MTILTLLLTIIFVLIAIAIVVYGVSLILGMVDIPQSIKALIWLAVAVVVLVVLVNVFSVPTLLIK